MAIDYAEVSPEKIKKWRSLARTKALIPTISSGINRSASELLHWDSGPNPDNLLKGREFLDWDVSVAWKLSDLVWSDDQTSIDSRSKLMVELRDDIVDQVTRLYFERRRVQIELLAIKEQEASQIDKQMRMAELTALIDGYTGGEFSQRIRRNGS